jgi:hypothetical protein
MPVTVRPSLAVAVNETLNVPLGRPVRFAGAVIRERLTVFTRWPRTLTTALTHVIPGSLRIRMVKRRRLTHDLADGSVKAFAAEIGAGLVAAGVEPEDAGVGVGVGDGVGLAWALG